MRRILLALTVALMLVAMLAIMAAPAFASKFPPGSAGSCGTNGTGPGFPFGQNFVTFGEAHATLHFCPQ